MLTSTTSTLRYLLKSRKLEIQDWIVQYLCIVKEIVSLGEEAHLNTSFKHFVYFIQVSVIDEHSFLKVIFLQEFELIDKKELAPLQVENHC